MSLVKSAHYNPGCSFDLTVGPSVVQSNMVYPPELWTLQPKTFWQKVRVNDLKQALINAHDALRKIILTIML